MTHFIAEADYSLNFRSNVCISAFPSAQLPLYVPLVASLGHLLQLQVTQAARL